jgi:hypothetical protein
MREEVNDSIRARKVRAVFPDGSAEIMATELAIRKAQRLGLDLVLVAPEAELPVAKAMERWNPRNRHLLTKTPLHAIGTRRGADRGPGGAGLLQTFI